MEIGELIFDPESQCFEVTVSEEGNTYDFTLCDFQGTERDRAVALAGRIAGWLASDLEQVKDFAVRQLLGLKNDAWLEEGQVPVTAEGFRSVVRLEGINAFGSGNFEVYLDDGDLFWGHLIQVDVNRDFVPLAAYLVG